MRFWKNEDGAVLVYVTLILAAFIGVGGLAMDAGRAFTLREEMQQAADAAALAGAWQLDGTAAGAARADAAARAVVANSQKWASGGPAAVTIGAGTAGVQFLSTVPSSDDAALTFTTAAPFDYIWVRTAPASFNPWFMRMFGFSTATQVAGEAVARKGSSRCQVTPMFMCLPGGFDITNPGALIGKQVIARQGQGNSWGPGDWGLLDNPNGSQATGALVDMIAGSNGLPQCISSNLVEPKPGYVAAANTAFNVRLDMYETPHSSQYKDLDGYPPAENVGKGMQPQNAQCNNFQNTASNTRLGRDTSFTNRYGNGQWDCAGYWATAHPGDTANIPANCTLTTSYPAGPSRFQVYRHEIFHLPNKALVPNTTGASPAGDNANPQCYTRTIPPTPTAPSQFVNDRRIFVVAGVDCAANQPQANTPLPVSLFVSTFITEPVVGAQGDLYLEIVGYDQGGGGGLVPIQLREWTELVR